MSCWVTAGKREMRQSSFAELEHAPGEVPGEDGQADAVVEPGGAHRAVLSEGGSWPKAVSAGDDAAGALRAVVLQPERSGDGGPAVRGGVGATVRAAEADGADAGRDDDPELPAPAGASWPGGVAVRGDQRASSGARAQPEDGDDRGREHHRGADIDEEQGEGAGSGDASDEEGEPVAFRDEGAHRGGRGIGAGAQPCGDAGERVGRGDGAQGAARRRGAGVGGRGVPGRRQA